MADIKVRVGQQNAIKIISSNSGSGSIVSDVIGGIASVTSLKVSGISTLGSVKIDSGIVTSISGVVTYYGDARYLTNVTADTIGTLNSINVSGLGTVAGTFTAGLIDGGSF